MLHLKIMKLSCWSWFVLSQLYPSVEDVRTSLEGYPGEWWILLTKDRHILATALLANGPPLTSVRTVCFTDEFIAFDWVLMCVIFVLQLEALFRTASRQLRNNCGFTPISSKCTCTHSNSTPNSSFGSESWAGPCTGVVVAQRRPTVYRAQYV